jgi:hypothetical protein
MRESLRLRSSQVIIASIFELATNYSLSAVAKANKAISTSYVEKGNLLLFECCNFSA